MSARIAFSTLACPSWGTAQIIEAAEQWGYAGIEFRVVEGETELWKLPAFRGAGRAETRRALNDAGLVLPCIDTSAHFHSPAPTERRKNFNHALRMAELAAELRAPAIRVFGDRVQPGHTHDETAQWIAESLLDLEAKLPGVAIWLETHGDFARTSDLEAILSRTGNRIPLIWDPANALIEYDESPSAGATALQGKIHHVHLKDFRRNASGWEYALTGEGEMPFEEVHAALEQENYAGFYSFEWEKYWHPSLAGPEVALPHFARWFTHNWKASLKYKNLSGGGTRPA